MKSNETILTLKLKLIILQIGTCGCGVKTPEIKYHSDYCTYRLAVECMQLVEKMENDHAEELRLSTVRGEQD